MTIYTGIDWKHHISEHFNENNINVGVGKGGTIFIDYYKMIDYLKEDGREWHIAELNLENEPLYFEFNCNFMATVQRNIPSKEGFKKINLK